MRNLLKLTWYFGGGIACGICGAFALAILWDVGEHIIALGTMLAWLNLSFQNWREFFNHV